MLCAKSSLLNFFQQLTATYMQMYMIIIHVIQFYKPLQDVYYRNTDLSSPTPLLAV